MNSLISRTTNHLTHEQLCDLLLASSAHTPESESSPSKTIHIAEDHLRSCLQCTAELQNLRSSLSSFRQAATSYAGQVYARTSINRASIAPSPRYRSHILYWATAAALAIAVALPLGLHKQHHHPIAPQPAVAAAVTPQAAESDEALLDGIAQDLSTDVPSSMQPLADPTASTATVQYISVQRKN
jgi:hypothetical protein